jgi:hypothetical protein
MSSREETMLKIERDISDSLKKVFVDEFSLPEAILFGIETFIGEPPMINPISKNQDVYDMLFDEDTPRQIAPYTKFVVVTCGWAAPLEDEEKEDDTIRPSLHPNRKRVKMTLLCDNGKITSAIAFKGEKEIVVDVGNATGDLKEAILDLYYKSRTMKEEICND